MRKVEDMNNLPNISLGEFMELSLLAFFDGSELHRDTPVLYKGAYWNIHTAVTYVAPAEQIEKLRARQ